MAPAETNDALMISYREMSLTRAKDFCTTNGMIQVTLCGLFATTVAVLVALGEPVGANATPRVTVFQYVIPGFSIVIATVSFRVYTWIHEQLWYLAHFGRDPRKIRNFLSLEECREIRESLWAQKSGIMRWWLRVKGTIRFYVAIPFGMSDIYRYYLLLYLSAPFFSLWHVDPNWHRFLWRAVYVILIELVLAFFGLRNTVCVRYLNADLKKAIDHA